MNTIAKLREMEAKATKGPWDTNGSWRVFAGLHTETLKVVCYSGNNIQTRTQINNDNIDLCAAARNALPTLLAIAEAAGKVKEAWHRSKNVPGPLDMAIIELSSHIDKLEEVEL